MDPEDESFPLADSFVEDHCHLRLRSEPDRIAPAVDLLIRRAQEAGVVHPHRAARVQMALHEALTNSIIHGNLGISSALKERGDDEFFRAVAARMSDPAYAGRIVDVRATLGDGVATWVFTDQGAGFDVAAALRRLEGDEPDLLRPSGRGLIMIRAFTDEMCYEDRGRKLTLRLGKHGEEKRGSPRVPLGGSVRVTPIGPGGAVDPAAGREAVARDISPGGIGFLQSDLAPSGRVMITIQTSGELICVPAEVRHWHALGDQIIEVGCRFETPLPVSALPDASATEPVAAIGRLVDQMADQLRPHLERRTAPRLPYSERISIELGGGAVVPGIARDLSRNGVAFFSTTSLPLEVVHLTLPGGPSESAIRLPARVVRCTRLVDGFYDVAAQFAA